MFSCFVFFLSFFWLGCFSQIGYWIWFELCLLLIIVIATRETPSSSLLIFLLFELGFSLCYLLWSFWEVAFFYTIFCAGKLGLFPFWFWVFRFFQDFSFRLCIIVITFFKVLVVVILVSFSPSVPFLLLVCLNFFRAFGLFLSIQDLKIFFCFCVILSRSWLVFFVFRELTFVYFLVYFLMLWSMLLLLFKEVFSSFFVFLWMRFYLGFPFLGSFFIKVAGLFDFFRFSVISCFLIFSSGIIFILCLFLLSSIFYVRIGLIFLIFLRFLSFFL